MEKMFGKLFGVTVMATLFCLAGMVMSADTFAQMLCENNLDHTITDHTTGLMWQRETADRKSYNVAMSYASGLSLGGHSNWRLPGSVELQGLYHSPCKKLVSVENDWYWSADLAFPSIPWRVSFENGSSSYNTTIASDLYYVIAVRTVQ